MHCITCAAKMRPNKSSAADYPGTIQHVGMGICRRCHDRMDRRLADRRREMRAKPEPMPTAVDRARDPIPGLKHPDPKIRDEAQKVLAWLKSRNPARPDDDANFIRVCQRCAEPFVKWSHERPSRFQKRLYCSPRCASRGALEKAQTVGEAA